MKISLIAAMADNRVIGIENRLPWKLPGDMKWFRRHTLGKPVIMGRKTWESFGAKPLPERTNIVITRDPDYAAPGAMVAHDIDAALTAAGEVDEVMVIGGENIYRQVLPRADRLYLTRVHCEPEGDAWFPDYDESAWRVVERIDNWADEKNPFDYTFLILEKL